jgi:hypothetical protein
MFSHELEVGVKCSSNRGCFASQALAPCVDAVGDLPRRGPSCPIPAARPAAARLLLLCLLLRSSWLIAGRPSRGRWSAASPGRTGSLGRIGQRGLVAFQLATLAASSPDFQVLG